MAMALPELSSLIASRLENGEILPDGYGYTLVSTRELSSAVRLYQPPIWLLDPDRPVSSSLFPKLLRASFLSQDYIGTCLPNCARIWHHLRGRSLIHLHSLFVPEGSAASFVTS